MGIIGSATRPIKLLRDAQMLRVFMPSVFDNATRDDTENFDTNAGSWAGRNVARNDNI